MPTLISTGAGFLIAVLWFDLMFDVQVRGHAGTALPAEVLDSIARYYRRVTTNARPMNRLISVVMLLTLASIAGEIVEGWTSWRAWISLLCALSAIGLAGARTVPNAVKLGRATDTSEEQSHLARAIYGDHLLCLAAISSLLALQLSLALIG
jgi:hypothetical protein